MYNHTTKLPVVVIRGRLSVKILVTVLHFHERILKFPMIELLLESPNNIILPFYLLSKQASNIR